MTDGKQVVRDLIDKICAEEKYKRKNVKINPISSEGANYTSALYTITVTTDEESLELFAKVAIIEGILRTQMNADWIYETEKVVYTKIFKVYEQLQDKYTVPEEHRFVFPKCYGFNSDTGKETVLMENLMAKGYKPYDRFKIMDWETAALSMEILARFHALSFAYAKDYSQDYKEVTEKMVYHIVNVDENDAKVVALWTQMIDRALKVVDEECRDKIREQLMEKDLMHKYHKPMGTPVLAHGDYRLSNLLFRRQGKTLEGIPLDFQLVHAGCVATDLVYFIFLGSDEEFRRQHYEALLDHYYDHLCQAMYRLNVDPVEMFPREEFDDQMKRTLPYVLYMGVVTLPMIVVEAENAPTMSGDDFESFMMPTNELYASRFRGIVNDCVRWGIL